MEQHAHNNEIGENKSTFNVLEVTSLESFSIHREHHLDHLYHRWNIPWRAKAPVRVRWRLSGISKEGAHAHPLFADPMGTFNKIEETLRICLFIFKVLLLYEPSAI